jgi:hypothetical protein
MWRVAHPEEGLLLGVVLVPCQEDIIDPFPFFLDSKMIVR